MMSQIGSLPKKMKGVIDHVSTSLVLNPFTFGSFASLDISAKPPRSGPAI